MHAGRALGLRRAPHAVVDANGRSDVSPGEREATATLRRIDFSDAGLGHDCDLEQLPKVISEMVGGALPGAAANRQVCPTISEMTFGNHFEFSRHKACSTIVPSGLRSNQNSAPIT